MARYIDADKLTDKLEELQFNAPVMTPVMKIYNVIELVEDQPAADVVEVVRCRNCKHAYFRYNMKDTLQEIYACRKRPAGRCHKKVSGDFFCKHGERRTDNDL